MTSRVRVLKKYWQSVAAVILAAVLLISAAVLMRNRAIDQKTYLHDVFRSINSVYTTLWNLQNTLIPGDDAQFAALFRDLDRDLWSLDQLLTDGINLAHYKIRYGPNGRVFPSIARAFTGELSADWFQEGFAEDGRLSDNELMFIGELSTDLKVITNAMVDEYGDVNPSFTIESLDTMLSEFTAKWNKYDGTAARSNSPFDYLLVQN